MANPELNTYTPDNFITGPFPIATRPITIDDGNLAARSVLGKITATGKYILSLAAASDGSEVPVCILVDACDATGGDKIQNAYFAGEFNPSLLVLGTGHTVASIGAKFPNSPIFLRAPL